MKWKGKANSRGISKAVDLAEKEAERYGVEEEQRIRFSLSLEETLLICRDRYGETAEVSLRMRRRGRDLTAELILPESPAGAFDGADLPLAGLLKDWKGECRRGHYRRSYTFRLEKTRSDLLRFVWQYTRPHKGWFFLGVLMQALLVGIQVAAPMITARVIVALTEGAAEQILLAALALLVIEAAANVFSIMAAYWIREPIRS